MSANKGVDRYRSAVSGNMASRTLPSFAVCATFSAAFTVAPADIPTNMPSDLANAKEVLMDSSSLTGIIWSAMSFSNTSGMKSGVQPCIL